MQKISVFVTTFNNEETLNACLASLSFADEILVLDSNSTDATREIAAAFDARVTRNEFLGYGRQKQLAMEQTTHDWIMFLDADEMVSEALGERLARLKATGKLGADGVNAYEFPRNEQLFWRMSADSTRKNFYVRLFQREVAKFSEMPVHATVEVSGKVDRIVLPFFHFGETDVYTKVDKINAYSSGLVREKLAKKEWPSPWIMVLYPPFFFIRSFIFKRGFANGWAGFMASVIGSFYVFLKYAKLYEHYQFKRIDTKAMPAGAPRTKTPLERFEGPS